MSEDSTRQKLLSGAAILSVSQLTAMAVIFLRNVVIVRALSTEEFGLASTLALTLSFLEMSSNLNIERFVIQANDGDSARFLRNGHLLRFAQGLILSAVLLVMSPFVAHLFNADEAIASYRLLAIIPLLNGLTHFDIARHQRRMNFKPQAIADVAAELVSLVLVLALLPVLADHRIVLWALISQWGARMLVTHLTADQRYRWSFDRSYVGRFFAFGWPLILNAMLMFVALQGDRFLIGSAQTLHEALEGTWLSVGENGHIYDRSDLALYSVVVSLTAMPTLIVGRVGSSLVMPLLSRRQDDRAHFSATVANVARLAATVGGAVSVLFIVGGGALVEILYTSRYAGARDFLAWLALAAGIRILRIAFNEAPLALADTKIPPMANLGRATAFLVALTATLFGQPLWWIAMGAAVGEASALLILLIALRSRQGIVMGLAAVPFAFVVLASGIAYLLSLATATGGQVLQIAVALVAVCLTILLGMVAFPNLQMQLRELRRES